MLYIITNKSEEYTMKSRILFTLVSIAVLSLPTSAIAVSNNDAIETQKEFNISISQESTSDRVVMMRAKEAFNLLSQGDFKEFSYGPGDYYFVQQDHSLRPDDEVFGYILVEDVEKFGKRVWNGENHF